MTETENSQKSGSKLAKLWGWYVASFLVISTTAGGIYKVASDYFDRNARQSQAQELSRADRYQRYKELKEVMGRLAGGEEWKTDQWSQDYRAFDTRYNSMAPDNIVKAPLDKFASLLHDLRAHEDHYNNATLDALKEASREVAAAMDKSEANN